MQPEYFHDPDKKTMQFQPDLTQNNHAANYEYPLNPHNGHLPIGQNIPMKISRSISEHHYDVPHLATKYVPLLHANLTLILIRFFHDYLNM